MKVTATFFFVFISLITFCQGKSNQRNQRKLLQKHLWVEDFSHKDPSIIDHRQDDFFSPVDKVDSTDYNRNYLEFRKGGKLIIYQYADPKWYEGTPYQNTDVWVIRWRLRNGEIQINYKGLKNHYYPDSKLIEVTEKLLRLRPDNDMNHYLSKMGMPM